MTRIVRWVLVVSVLLFLYAGAALAAAEVGLAPIPTEVRSDYFSVSINGRQTPVVHAASSYYLLRFAIEGPATVSVRGPDAHYWDRGVEIQPMRYGIRPVRRGAVISFQIPGPVKLAIARPGDHFAESQMLFLLGSAPERVVPGPGTAGVRFYGPGVHREDIEAHSGDRIYLAPGAVVFGSLTLWRVHDVRVSGGGMIVYEGPQDPTDDQGWMQRPAWHCITMDQATNVEIDGITCIVRSRTWQIQMRDSRGVGFYDVNVIGGMPRDANQDGMDFLGSSEVTVRNCFIRASDDDFAIQGNWPGYSAEAMRTPGHAVSNITIEDSVLSTSISNTIRVGWPRKSFDSAHVRMQNLDVIHTGFGACVVPFAFFELWADPEGYGAHSDYSFSDIRLEDYYALLQIRQKEPAVRNIVFSNITAMDGPPMVPSVLKGDVKGVQFDGVRVLGRVAAANADIVAGVEEGAAQPEYRPGAVDADFDYEPGLIRAGERVTFRVALPVAGWRYEWLFGDGTRGEGRLVSHAFADGEGTLLDGSGRFRVLLRASRGGESVWAERSVVVAGEARRAERSSFDPRPGLTRQRTEEGTAYEGWLRIPADGGYTVTLVSSRGATLAIDDAAPARTPAPRMQVCGSLGDAVQETRLSLELQKGLHRIRMELKPGVENGEKAEDGRPALYWEGPQVRLQPIPAEALVHAAAP